MTAPHPESRSAPLVPAKDGGASSASEGLNQAYGGLLRRLFAWGFGNVRVPADADNQLKALAQRGTVVYVGRSPAVVTFLFFQHLFVRLGTPIAEAVSGLGVSVWQPWGRLFVGRKVVRAPFKDKIVEAARAGRSGMVFLRKPGSLAGQIRWHYDPFPELVALQRTQERPIFFVPQLLIWERRPNHLRKRLWDYIFGEPEAPGFFRSLFALLWNRQRAFVKFAEPVNLQQFVAESEGLDDATIARKVRGSIHQHLARETRVITGPPLKEPERLVEETLRDRTLRATLAEVARERGRADGSVEEEAAKDLREIAAKYSPTYIGIMGWLLNWVFSRIYDGLDVDEKGMERIARANAQMPLIICPSHKSHMDYLVMSAVFYFGGLTPPHIAAGINLSFFPLGPWFRRCGAYFIRRTFKGDKVYGAVLKAYIKKLVKDGFSQEFFVEGGRSRTGKVLQPKFGMLSMEVDAWIEGARPDIAFVPTWIGYEKVIEGKSYAHELAGGEKKAEDIGSLLRAPKVLKSRYGRIHIRYDETISLAALAAQRGFDRMNHTEDQKRGLVRTLGYRIVEGVNRVTEITPSGLLATALLSHDRRGLTQSELLDRMQFLLKLAADDEGKTSFPLDAGALDPLGSGPLAEARASFEKDGAIVTHRTDGEPVFSAVDQHRVAMDYYKNAIIHFYVAEALLATALLTTERRERSAIEARTQALSRLLKQEFIYGSGSFSSIFSRRVSHFLALGLIEEKDGELLVTESGAPRVRMLADLLVNFIESYTAAADALELLLKGPMDRKEWMAATLSRSRAAYLAGKMRKFESLSKVTLENAAEFFEEQGLVVKSGEKGKQRALAPAMASAEAIRAKVAEIRAFLVEKAE